MAFFWICLHFHIWVRSQSMLYEVVCSEPSENQGSEVGWVEVGWIYAEDG
jgi:hypothetical protein